MIIGIYSSDMLWDLKGPSTSFFLFSQKEQLMSEKALIPFDTKLYNYFSFPKYLHDTVYRLFLRNWESTYLSFWAS